MNFQVYPTLNPSLQAGRDLVGALDSLSLLAGKGWGIGVHRFQLIIFTPCLMNGLLFKDTIT